MFKNHDKKKLKNYLSFLKNKQNAPPSKEMVRKRRETSNDGGMAKQTKQNKRIKKEAHEKLLIEDVQTFLTNDDDNQNEDDGCVHDSMSTLYNNRSQQLASKARQKLSNSLFRSLNEYLYSHSSYEARRNFTEEKFKLYHQAYANILEHWPIKPIDYLIDVLKKRIKSKDVSETAMADIGCGKNARIAMAFPTATVHSFDLYSDGESSQHPIIRADMSSLPIESNSCHYAIYSLSLMPVNLRDCFYEANRILQVGGHMLIVEVASRFADYTSTTKRIVHQEKHLGQLFSQDLRCFGFQLVKHELLQPDDFFVYFCLKKTTHLENSKKKSTLPSITLKACVYKTR